MPQPNAEAVAAGRKAIDALDTLARLVPGEALFLWGLRLQVALIAGLAPETQAPAQRPEGD